MVDPPLGWFLADPRFEVSVGGNPNVVLGMVAEAKRRLPAVERVSARGEQKEANGTVEHPETPITPPGRGRG